MCGSAFILLIIQIESSFVFLIAAKGKVEIKTIDASFVDTLSGIFTTLFFS
jgi:hypothetical protein